MRKKYCQGFTLVEMLIYIGILSIFMLVLAEIFHSVINVQLESASHSFVQQDSQFIISRLTSDVHRAENIILPASIGEESTSLQIVIDGQNHTYAPNNGDLQLTDNLGSANLNSIETSVSNFNITRLGNPGGKNSLQINFTITSRILQQGQAESQNYQTVLKLR